MVMDNPIHVSFFFITRFTVILFLFLHLATPTHKQSHDPKYADEAEQDNPITRFQNYLRINTSHPNPDYSSAVSYLLSQANSIGLQVQTFEFIPNKPVLLLSWPGSNPSLPSLLFNSHIDTVTAEPSKWVHPPWSAFRTQDGKIFGRGSQDVKCVGMWYLEAIRNLKQKNFVPFRTVHVSFVPDEEIGGFDGAEKFVASKEFNDLNVGFVLDEGPANPGDEFRVFYACRIPWHMTIKAMGTPGHGARLYDNSAMENLMKSMEIITKFRESQFDLAKAGILPASEVISVNPVFLKSGIPSPSGFVMNMQPSEAEAGFDLRFPPTADPDVIRRKIVEEWAPASRNMTFEIIQKGPMRNILGRPVMTLTNDSNPWWSVFKQAIYAVGGKLAEPEILPSTIDLRYFAQTGIPALGFSPMANTPILQHDHNEFLEDTVYLKGIGVYESVISTLSNFEDASS